MARTGIFFRQWSLKEKEEEYPHQFEAKQCQLFTFRVMIHMRSQYQA
jgi:hypothetical protein